MHLNQIAVTEDRAKLHNELTALHHYKKFVLRLAKQVQELQKRSYTMLSARYLPLLLLQPLRWCCFDCVIHHERDVR